MNTKLWSLFEAFVYYLAYLASGLIARLLLLIYHAIRMALENSVNHMVFDNQIFFEQVIHAVEQNPMLIVLLANIVVVVLYVLFIRCRGEKFTVYAALEKPSAINVFGAIGCGICLHDLLSFVMVRFFSQAAAMQEYNQYMAKLMDANIWLVLLVVVIVAPVVEEIVFRGVLFRALSRSMNPAVAVILTAALFAVAHGDPVQMVYAFLLGLVLALVRVTSKRLLPCIALHLAFNGANFFYRQEGTAGGLPWYAIILLLGAFFWLTMKRKKIKIKN